MNQRYMNVDYNDNLNVTISGVSKVHSVKYLCYMIFSGGNSMKKLLSTVLCIVLICFALVGCGKDIIGEYLENYNTNIVTDDEIAKLNFYIIGDEISSAAKTTSFMRLLIIAPVHMAQGSSVT